MNINTKETYSEVYSVLNMLGENYIKRIPKNLYKMIKDSKSSTYNPKYTTEISLDKQHIKKESLSMIALFHLNYWCNSNEEKMQLKQIFKDNEEKYQAELREKYNPDNIFKNNKNTISNYENNISEETAISKYQKKNFFQRLFDKIKNLLQKN